jgi:hypothetical protein
MQKLIYQGLYIQIYIEANNTDTEKLEYENGNSTFYITQNIQIYKHTIYTNIQRQVYSKTHIQRFPYRVVDNLINLLLLLLSFLLIL